MKNQLQLPVTESQDDHKYMKLILGIIFDIVGMLSYILPGLGEFTDVIWAPLSGIILTKMYYGTTGKVAGFIEFIEEIVPGIDVIPTFTLTWIFVYGFKK
ncbi:hypothetical protein [Flavobacterium branchiophilum]|uniref:Uncharacterized protein n=1 Tax=Flavobacterium branchiophilum (strain FL-15) TaxID=1034807 RepID=G2Z7G4_FLABF|nr:hypothetical protein [Flavobacterium branchiophilum]CCB69069.1 Protein of unknown function [Flavobacterium branchiophilum FL-15]